MTKTHAERCSNKRRRKTSLTIFTSHFIARARKGCVGFYCEREREIEHNWNILTPLLWPSRCVFLVLWCSTGILSASSPDLNSSGPKGPFGLMWLSLPHLVSNCLELYWQLSRTRTQLNYHHHHHIVLAARISLTLSRHSSLSFIALGRSSGQQPVSSHSCWMYVRAGRPAFARPCVGIHKSTSLMSSSLLLQQCPACLVRLTWIVFVIGGRWPYSWCLVGCCCQDLFRIARSILV